MPINCATKSLFELVCGDANPLVTVNREMDALLSRLKIPHEYEEIPGLGHDPHGVYARLGVKGFAFHAAHFA